MKPRIPRISKMDKAEVKKFGNYLRRVAALINETPPVSRDNAQVQAYKEIYGDDTEV